MTSEKMDEKLAEDSPETTQVEAKGEEMSAAHSHDAPKSKPSTASKKAKPKANAVEEDDGFASASASAYGPDSKEIPVEELVDGAIDALGQGLEILINTGASVGSRLSQAGGTTFSEIRTRTEPVLSGVFAGFEAFCSRVCGRVSKGTQGEDHGFFDEAGK
nr:Putative head maturation protease, phage-related [uncultured bacterium]